MSWGGGGHRDINPKKQKSPSRPRDESTGRKLNSQLTELHRENRARLDEFKRREEQVKIAEDAIKAREDEVNASETERRKREDSLQAREDALKARELAEQKEREEKKEAEAKAVDPAPPSPPQPAAAPVRLIDEPRRGFVAFARDQRYAVTTPNVLHDPSLLYSRGVSWEQARLPTQEMPLNAYARVKLHEIAPPDPVYTGVKEFRLMVYLKALFGAMHAQHKPIVPMTANFRVFDSCSDNEFESIVPLYLEQMPSMMESIMFVFSVALSNAEFSRYSLQSWMVGRLGIDYNTARNERIVPEEFLKSYTQRSHARSPARMLFFETIIQHRLMADSRQKHFGKGNQTPMMQNAIFVSIVKKLRTGTHVEYPW